MDMVVVHPAYWRRGHGTLLVKWGMGLSDMDRVNQGVIAAEMGEKLHLRSKYIEVDKIFVESETEHKSNVNLGVLERAPKSSRNAIGGLFTSL